MALLGQQELLEAPPRRRIIVPDGHSAHWGVDSSVGRVAVAHVASDGSRGARTAPFADLEGAARLATIWLDTRSFVRELARVWPRPGLVWVEQPSGKTVNHPLEYAVGVILGAVFDGLYEAYGCTVRVETVPSASWKKLATGYGAHYKPTKAKLGRAPEFMDYGVARWARANGYTGFSYDECDALGIAEAARREVALDVR